MPLGGNCSSGMNRCSNLTSPNAESRIKLKCQKAKNTKQHRMTLGKNVKLLPYVNEIPIDPDVASKATFTLSKFTDKLKALDGNESARSKLVIPENGWCHSDGTPWEYNNMPHDEAALLRKGVVNRNGFRLTYCSPNPAYNSSQSRFYNDLELLKEDHVDNINHHKNLNGVTDNAYSVSTQKQNFTLPQLSTNPITIAELNSRGLVDQKGKLHFGIQSLVSSGSDKCPIRMTNDDKERHVVLKESHESLPLTRTCDGSNLKGSETTITFLPDYEASSKLNNCNNYSYRSLKTRKKKDLSAPPMNSPSAKPVLLNRANGTIRCEAGRKDDRATVIYTVTSDGRNYEVKTDDGHHIHLEFNKRHAYLMVD